MVKVKIFSHNDLDGVGCPIVLKRVYSEMSYTLCSYDNINKNVMSFIRSGSHKNYDTIFITDISVNQEVASLIEAINEGMGFPLFRLFDHHVTANWLNRYDWALVQPEYEDKSKACGTSLLYDYLVHMELADKEDWDLATFVEKVRRYDTWEWTTIHNDTHAKQLNDLLYIMGSAPFINRFFKDISTDFTDMEKMLLEIEQNRINYYISQKGKELIKQQVEGYLVGFVFADRNQSILGNRLAEDNPDIDMVIMIDPGSLKLSYRTVKDIDVNEFAKRFGGGGHPKSAGSPLDKELVSSWTKQIFETIMKESSVS